MPVSGRPGRSSDQAGRESRISKKHGGWALESARTISGCLARLSWMPVPSTPMRPRPNPGKNCLHQRWCGFPAAWWNSTHSISYGFIQMLPPSNPSGYPLRNASLVLERNTYGRSIVYFRSCQKRVLELPSRWVARIKDACFLPFPRVLILEAGIWFHHEAATASEFRQLCGQPGESRRHDRRLVTTPNASREAKSHVVLFMSCISRNLPLPHKHLDGPRAIWPCYLGSWKTDQQTHIHSFVIWREICISKSSRFDHGHGTVYGLKKGGNNVAAAVVAPSGSWRLIGSLTSFRSRKEGVLVFVRLQRESPRETPSRQSVRRSLRPPRVLVGRSPIVFEIVGVLFYKKHGNSSHHSHPTERASALFSQHPPIPPWGSARTPSRARFQSPDVPLSTSS